MFSVDFPVNFTVSRESDAETSSPRTASTAIQLPDFLYLLWLPPKAWTARLFRRLRVGGWSDRHPETQSRGFQRGELVVAQPSERRLQGQMEAVEFYRERDLDAAPNFWLHVVEGDSEANDGVCGHAASLRSSRVAAQRHGRRAAKSVIL